MPRAGLDAEAVVAAAAELVDAEGSDALTLARLAERLGVRSPSLYAHVDGLRDLRLRLAARGARELSARIQAAIAGRARAEALAAAADAYRAYAREHPGVYAGLQQASGSESAELREAAAHLIETVVAILRGYGLEGDDAVHAVRIVRAALHGFVLLETSGGFQLALDVDETFARLVRWLASGADAPLAG